MTAKILLLSLLILNTIAQIQPSGDYLATDFRGQPINLTMTFEGGSVTWRYCNTAKGGYTISGNVITIENGVSWTRMYCPTLVVPESDIFAAIPQSHTYTLNNGVLSLFDSSGVLILKLISSSQTTTPTTLPIPAPTTVIKPGGIIQPVVSKGKLQGSWALKKVLSQSFTSCPSLVFTSDTIRFKTGNSNTEYKYETNGNVISISSTSPLKVPLFSKMMVNPVEDRIKQAFTDSYFYDLFNNALTFRNRKGETLVVLSRETQQ